MIETDVIIVGSGMAGLCLANLLLKQTNLSIVVVGAINPEENKNNARVCAFNHNSLNILRYIGFSDDYFFNNCSFYNDMYIWQEQQKYLNFNASELGFSNLGGIIPNHKVELGLWHELKDNSRVTLIAPIKAESLQSEGNEHYVTLSDKSIIKANLVVGADGKFSWVRNQLGIATTNSCYGQQAIVAKISCSNEHKKTAWQKFLPTGPLAFLPLSSQHELSIVWSAETAYAEKLMNMSDNDFTNILKDKSDNKLGDFELLTKRFSYKLESQHAKSYIANHACLIGDAAHVAHPLAGQGVNAGLLDAAILSTKLSENSENIQSAVVEYQKATRGRNSGLIFAMGQIKNLFETNNIFVRTSRGIGLELINKSRVIKRNMAKHALGLGNNLPASIVLDEATEL